MKKIDSQSNEEYYKELAYTARATMANYIRGTIGRAEFEKEATQYVIDFEEHFEPDVKRMNKLSLPI